MPTTRTSVTLKCGPQTLRDFLGATANLPAISDPDLQLKVVEADEIVTADGVITFQISAYGLKQTMQHRYIEVTASRIVAEQIEGPTRSWTHRQILEDNGDGTCTLIDEIEFEPPGGMLGFVMTADKIRESIEDGMEFRYDALQEILEAD